MPYATRFGQRTGTVVTFEGLNRRGHSGLLGLELCRGRLRRHLRPLSLGGSGFVIRLLRRGLRRALSIGRCLLGARVEIL